MCLHNILGKPDKTEGIGYKVYDLRNGSVYTHCFSMSGSCISEPVLFGVKYKSIKNLEWTDDNKKYKTGFHIFKSIKGAKKCQTSERYEIIVKVKYRKSRLHGTQRFMDNIIPCIIADEITLLEIIK